MSSDRYGTYGRYERAYVKSGYKNVSSDQYGTYGSYERTYVKGGYKNVRAS